MRKPGTTYSANDGRYLNEARLTEVRLNEASLTEARLNEARLTEARLNEARLTEARLNEARLTEARLTEEKLNDASSGVSCAWLWELLCSCGWTIHDSDVEKWKLKLHQSQATYTNCI